MMRIPFLAVAIFLGASTGATHPICAEERPAVLFVADRQHGSPESIRTWGDWLEAEFEIDAKPISEVNSIDVLRPYNVTVINRTRLLGFVDVGRNPNPWFEMKQASCMAVSTWEKGSLIDDAQASYFASCYDMEDYIPIDYHAVTTPEEIAAAATGRVNVFTGGATEDLYNHMQTGGGAATRRESPAWPGRPNNTKQAKLKHAGHTLNRRRTD